ncbi:hypothetical protein GLAREA_11557 [Glarea lozoyensis ATCC 20868]|uniref:Uncharacterized protein n=1 Tax=Glarea lozoyensis (strain ATCC 20868 / MF5171) TaxID=1116229 RepID=S3CYR8_GLAL2|nr:uncharacterized protein GLAREA_11557 [Glarea lozoyensis ATCC 20868]EPE24976.1 hypothetical protein GLAREA_11557 [Glarea lozoyensis ATCC 20868]
MSTSGACSTYPDNCGELQPNADIAGKGVFASLLSSACLTLLAAIFKYFTNFRVKHAKLIEFGDLPQQNSFRNLQILFGRLAKHMSVETATLWNNTLHSLIIGLADQQAFVALAILTVAAVQRDSISIYHFNIVSYLAWYSSFTHAMTLLVLVDWMVQSKFLFYLRMSIFAVVIGMVTWSQLASFDYSDALNGRVAACPNICNAQPAALHTRLRIACLFACAIQISIEILWASKRWKKSTTAYAIIVATRTFHIVCFVSTMFMVAGIGNIGFVRDTSRYQGLVKAEGFDEQENAWGFGQLVPLIMLGVPVVGAVEGFVDERKRLSLTPKDSSDFESGHSSNTADVDHYCLNCYCPNCTSSSRRRTLEPGP